MSFLLVAIFIILWVTAIVAKPINISVTETITKDITQKAIIERTEEFVELCESRLGLAKGTPDYEFCVERTRAGFKLTNFAPEDCSLCGPRPNYTTEEGLCLKGTNLAFCEGLFTIFDTATEQVTADAQQLPIARFGNFINSYTDFFDNLTQKTINLGGFPIPQWVIVVILLSLLGFFIGGGSFFGLQFRKR